MTDIPDLDHDTVRTLATAYLTASRERLARLDGPVAPLEVLNALAAAAAVVLRGTGPDPKAVAFFNDALTNNLKGDDP